MPVWFATRGYEVAECAPLVRAADAANPSRADGEERVRNTQRAGWVVIGITALLVGCGGPDFGRIGPAAKLPNGLPRTRCEIREWYELAPARMQATGMTAGVLHNTHYSQVNEGWAAFRYGSDDPEDVEELWPKMNEPELQRSHDARIEPVDAAHRSSLYWSLGALGGLAAGLGTAAAVQGESQTAANIAGVGGLVIGLVGLVGVLASQPSGEDQLYADARRQLFIPGEDDMDAVARGIDRANARRRVQCGGYPAAPPALAPSSTANPPGAPASQAPASP